MLPACIPACIPVPAAAANGCIAAEASGESESDDDTDNLLWFETEEEFFTAASKCASLYFLPERRIFFADTSLFAPGQHDTAQQHEAAAQAGTVYRVLQRGSEKEILSDNTGGAVYDAAIVLSRYLAAKEADHMAGKTVLELGCGPGLVSMVAARLVHASGYVCATDGDISTVRLAAENLALIPEANTAAARFWWGTPPDDVPEMRGRKWDYVVASDVAYEPAVFEPLCEALRAVCSQAHTKVLLCNGVRSSTREKRLRKLLERDFTVDLVDVSDLSFSQEEDEEGEAQVKMLHQRRFHRFTLLWILERR